MYIQAEDICQCICINTDGKARCVLGLLATSTPSLPKESTSMLSRRSRHAVAHQCLPAGPNRVLVQLHRPLAAMPPTAHPGWRCEKLALYVEVGRGWRREELSPKHK